ncbi:MAG TPA: DUF1080 domain-containing protein [Prolixibacteraceae bacterium]|jgi:hypothetical protein
MISKIAIRPLVFLLAMAFVVSCTTPKPKNEGWIQLFNGKDLKDWNIKITGFPLNENYGNTFRVEDSLLKVRYDQYSKFDGHFGHIFYKNPYSHYKIRVEYRFVGDQCPGGAEWAYRNSGIMIHGQSAQSMELNQDFPVSIEVQLLGGNGKDERSNLNVCTPGTNIVMNDSLWTQHCTNSTSKTYHGDQWVTVEVEVQGDSIIRHLIDGKTVMEYTQPQLDDRDPSFQKLLPPDKNKLLKKGTISLQGESNPVDFRKVELLNLGDECE